MGHHSPNFSEHAVEAAQEKEMAKKKKMKVDKTEPKQNGKVHVEVGKQQLRECFRHNNTRGEGERERGERTKDQRTKAQGPRVLPHHHHHHHHDNSYNQVRMGSGRSGGSTQHEV